MKKRLLLLMILITGIGVGIGIISSLGGLTGKFNAQPAAAQIETTPTAPLQEPIIPSATTTIASGSEADQLVEELNAKAVAKLQVGWVHIHENVNSDTDLSFGA